MVRGPLRARHVNGYDLGVSYVPSHRPKKSRIKASMAENQTFMNIHNFKPAIVKYTALGKAVSHCLTTPNRPCRKPTVPAALREGMVADWGGILAHVSFDSFTRTQFKRHGQHHKFGSDDEYFEQGYRQGRKYLRGGKYDLMRIMRRRGYKPGYLYSCKDFVKALNEELQHPVLVEFKYTREGVKYLDEISSLYELDSKRNRTCRDQKYDKNELFHLEDFSRVLKGKRLIERSKELMSMRVGLWGRKRKF